MARRPYYLENRDGVFYCRIYNSLTGRLLPARSTGERNQSRAHVVAAEWYRTGVAGIKKDKAENLADLFTFDSLAQGLKSAVLTPDQARRLVATLDTRGLLADQKAASNRGLIEFLTDFYDWDKSPFILEKRRLGQKIGKGHAIDMQLRVKGKWKPFFGDTKRLSEVTRADLKAFGRYLFDSGLSAASINKTMIVGKTAFGWCKREGILPVNVAEGLAQYKGEAGRRDILTVEEYAKLLTVAWADERAAVGALVASTAGLRIGEVLALTEGDIDDDRLQVRGSWSNVERLVKLPKNTKQRQAVLLPNVRDRLLALVAKNPHKPGKGPRFVFWSSVKATVPTDQKTLTDGFKEALRLCGIDDAQREERGLVFHGLRSLHATRLADHVDMRSVALSTGHDTESMAKHYANHASEAHFQAVVSAVKIAFPEAPKAGLEAFEGDDHDE